MERAGPSIPAAGGSGGLRRASGRLAARGRDVLEAHLRMAPVQADVLVAMMADHLGIGIQLVALLPRRLRTDLRLSGLPGPGLRVGLGGLVGLDLRIG